MTLVPSANTSRDTPYMQNCNYEYIGTPPNKKPSMLTHLSQQCEDFNLQCFVLTAGILEAGKSIPNLASRDAMEPPGTYSRKMFRVSSLFSVPCVCTRTALVVLCSKTEEEGCLRNSKRYKGTLDCCVLWVMDQVSSECAQMEVT